MGQLVSSFLDWFTLAIVAILVIVPIVVCYLVSRPRGLQPPVSSGETPIILEGRCLYGFFSCTESNSVVSSARVDPYVCWTS